MHHTSSQANIPSKLIAKAAFVIGLVGFLGTIAGAEPSAPSAWLPFGDEKVEWHGFDRYDFVMDEQTLAITGVESFYRDFPSEGTYISCRGPLFTECYDRYEFNLEGIQGAITVIVPKTAAPGTPWVFRSDFVDRDAKVDLALLAKGFHIVTGPVPFNADGPLLKDWDAVYRHLTEHGFSRKPVMQGEGGAAGDAYAWAVENPDKVSCVYAENPVLRSKMSKTPSIDNLTPLAKAGVPLLHVCGSKSATWCFGIANLAKDDWTPCRSATAIWAQWYSAVSSRKGSHSGRPHDYNAHYFPQIRDLVFAGIQCQPTKCPRCNVQNASPQASTPM
jgi:hypothetical protein